MQFRPITPQDNARSLRTIAAFLGIILVILVLIVLLPAPPLIWVLPAFCLGAVYYLAKRSTETTGYECPSCRHQFEIDLRTNLTSPHIWDKKYLRCPSCGAMVWSQAVIKVHPLK
jgi:DNA-directed RNA polymerase subunit RPC12/RpoP